MPLVCLVYVSSARSTFSEDELNELLLKSREKNTAADVTGLLLHIGGNFMQALEGEDTVVDRIYERISKDPRHSHVKTILRLPVTSRLFGDWAMAFKEASTLPPDARAETSPFLDEARRSELSDTPGDGSPVMRLLQRFATSLR